MFIVSLNYLKSLEEVDKHLEAHIAFLHEQYSKGLFIASGKKVPRTGGIILAQCESNEQLQTIIEQDPFYQAKIAAYEKIEFLPSMVATGLEKLMEG